MKKIDPQSWKADMPLFREKAIAYSKGEIKKAEYKGFSGRYGSYAQHDPSKNMLRLRMPAGRVTAQKLAYIAEAIRKYNVPRAHFTTCQTIQLHDMDAETTSDIMEGALDVGIVTMGGGGDFPRNTMCAPLSGVQKGEYFDVLPYAQAVGEFAMNFINAEPMPRKLKVGFSNSPENVTHATFRDMGYAARPDGKFDIYTAGGLGNNPCFGVKVAEAVEPDQLLFYLKAMWITFRTYGDYQNRGHARTRYLQEILGGADKYKQAYLEKLKEVYASGEDLTLHVDPIVFTKTGDGSTFRPACHRTKAGRSVRCRMASDWRYAGSRGFVRSQRRHVCDGAGRDAHCAVRDGIYHQPDRHRGEEDAGADTQHSKDRL